MARADNIWLVMLNHWPIQAFTVKHELVAYLGMYWPHLERYTQLKIIKLKDGYQGISGDDVTEVFANMKVGM